MKRFTLLFFALFGPLLMAPGLAQDVRYKCPNCGRYHLRATPTTTIQSTQVTRPQPAAVATAQASTTPAKASAVVPAASSEPAAQSASKVQTASAVVASPKAQQSRPRWRFHNANKWARRIDPRAQAWAQQEANRLAQRGYRGYLQNGHPGGNNPHASVTGTGTTFPGADLIHTCEGSSGMTLVAEAAAVSHDGRIYGVRSWR